MSEMTTVAVLNEVHAERLQQEDAWGEQNHPDGTGPKCDAIGEYAVAGEATGAIWGVNDNEELREAATERCQTKHDAGEGTWEHILTEEWAEALACDDPEALRHELVQVAAVAVAWIEAIDRRRAAANRAVRS